VNSSKEEKDGEYDLGEGPDPAELAAAEPEMGDPTNPVYAVGIGPGNPEYLTPRGKRAIAEANVVVGFETVIEFIKDLTDADLLTCGYRDESEVLSEFAKRVASGERGTAVLMGDPNHSGYQFVGKVQSAVGESVRIVPGISSLQVAASRARTPMEDSRFVTLHKSGEITDDLTVLRESVGKHHLLALPRPFDWMPGDIAAHLIEAGGSPGLNALVFEKLTHEDEAITRSSLGELAAQTGGSTQEETPFSDLSILVVRAD
jgi:cobalt-precorrin-7 (C5)-methyltransferase